MSPLICLKSSRQNWIKLCLLINFLAKAGPELSINADQASEFAKTVSNDFNPIHDPGNRRFCVPGDLLFALAVERYGLAQSMEFHFSGLVSADTALIFPFDQCEHVRDFGWQRKGVSKSLPGR